MGCKCCWKYLWYNWNYATALCESLFAEVNRSVIHTQNAKESSSPGMSLCDSMQKEKQIMTTIKFEYSNGGFGSIEHFYHEYLTLGEGSVQFSRKWNINLEENAEKRRLLERDFLEFQGVPNESMPKLPADFSWRCEPYGPMLERCVEAVAAILFSLLSSPDINSLEVCDGDSMAIEIAPVDGEPCKFHVCWHALPIQCRKAIKAELAKILPDGIALPPFLRLRNV